ncbi:MAG: MBL fold metallo-hydrolase [Myxococcales bacterium]|nr:MBL fold metallo-hydrolase [Myxococcales bacterium]
MTRHARLALILALSACGGPGSDGGGVETTSVGPSTSAGATLSTSADASTGGTASPTTTAPDDPSSSGPSASTDDGTAEVPEAALDVYWIDTEGGAATLFVTPDGPLVLVDAGFPGERDADRIAAVVDELGAEAIDLLVVSHFHVDHVGGVPALAERVPIAAYWDHGDSVEQGSPDGLALWQDYLAVADGLRTVVEPGLVQDIGGVEFTVVAAGTEVIAASLPGGGAQNPACDGAGNLPPDGGENGNSIGFVARFGGFELLDLGDLTWSYEDQLACPLNRLGPVDLYQTTHHGLAISGATQLVHGVDPLVVVMNNGANKGGEPATFERIADAPSQPDLWQQHRAAGNDAAHNAPEEFIANLEDGEADQGHAIHARVAADGTITVTNLRNGHAKAYASR